MTAQLTEEQVEKIATLAAMQLDSVEVGKFCQWLSEVLNYVEVLSELDTSATIETSQVTGLINVWQADQAKPSLSQAQALSNAPRKQNGYFKVDPALER